jgi:urease accessory protein
VSKLPTPRCARGAVRVERWAGAAVALVGVMCVAQPALAHHPMGGQTPETFLQGWLSGLAHPVIGLDHLVFVLGVGLWSAVSGLRWAGPAVFVAGTLGGCVVHLAGVDLMFGETLIAASLVLAGAAALIVREPSTLLLCGLLAAAGMLHGYAYGESIVGAESGALAAYLFGFACIQLVIAEAVRQVYVRLRTLAPSRAVRVGYAWAATSCAVGAAFLVM